MIKKQIFFFIFISLFLSYNNFAFAASTCFPETISTYYGTTENLDSAYDWRARNYSTGMVLRGVGICAISSASSQGTATTDVYRSRTSSSGNNACWCKLTYPIESKFMYYKNYSSESECAINCQIACVNLQTSGNINDIGKIYFNNPEGE